MASQINVKMPTFGASKRVSQIEVGTAFLGRTGSDEAQRLFFRGYDHVVELVDPFDTWVNSDIVFIDYEEVGLEIVVHRIPVEPA